jgi:Ca2+-binding EF-hand superfamily protein
MHIDADADGEISLSDMQEFLGKEMDSATVEAIFNDADVNGDGGLSFDEFQMMMLKVLKTSERKR